MGRCIDDLRKEYRTVSLEEYAWRCLEAWHDAEALALVPGPSGLSCPMKGCSVIGRGVARLSLHEDVFNPTRRILRRYKQLIFAEAVSAVIVPEPKPSGILSFSRGLDGVRNGCRFDAVPQRASIRESLGLRTCASSLPGTLRSSRGHQTRSRESFSVTVLIQDFAEAEHH